MKEGSAHLGKKKKKSVGWVTENYVTISGRGKIKRVFLKKCYLKKEGVPKEKKKLESPGEMMQDAHL